MGNLYADGKEIDMVIRSGMHRAMVQLSMPMMLPSHKEIIRLLSSVKIVRATLLKTTPSLI